MKITREKINSLQRKKQRRKDKILSETTKIIKKFGSKSLVFIDESGFEDNQDCIYAWSKKGKKVYGEQEGKRGKRENLVAGRRKKEKDLIAPIIFKVTLNAVGFKQWCDQHLLPSLKIPSVLLLSLIHI